MARRRTYVPRNDFEQSGARLTNIVLGYHKMIGGLLRYNWTAAFLFITYYPLNQNSLPDVVSFGLTEYVVTTLRSGPYIALDGTKLARWNAAGWQDFPTTGACFWTWFYADSLAGDMYVLSKWDYGNNNRSYCLRWNNATGALEFAMSSDGTAAAQVVATSSATITAGQWYFAGGFWRDSDDWGIAVGKTGDIDLTIDSSASAPVAAFVSAVPLLLGAAFNGGAYADYWDGGIGPVQMRETLVTAAEQQDYLREVFHETEPFYEAT